MVLMEDAIRQILDDLVAIPPVEGALVVTRKGRIVASRIPEGTDEQSLARECRAVLEAGSETIAPEGDALVRVDLRAAKGSTVVLRAGQDAILAVLTTTRTPESLNIELTRAAAAIREAVG